MHHLCLVRRLIEAAENGDNGAAEAALKVRDARQECLSSWSYHKKCLRILLSKSRLAIQIVAAGKGWPRRQHSWPRRGESYDVTTFLYLVDVWECIYVYACPVVEIHDTCVASFFTHSNLSSLRQVMTLHNCSHMSHMCAQTHSPLTRATHYIMVLRRLDVVLLSLTITHARLCLHHL